jgi:hypothetical protein
MDIFQIKDIVGIVSKHIRTVEEWKQFTLINTTCYLVFKEHLNNIRHNAPFAMLQNFHMNNTMVYYTCHICKKIIEVDDFNHFDQGNNWCFSCEDHICEECYNIVTTCANSVSAGKSKCYEENICVLSAYDCTTCKNKICRSCYYGNNKKCDICIYANSAKGIPVLKGYKVIKCDTCVSKKNLQKCRNIGYFAQHFYCNKCVTDACPKCQKPLDKIHIIKI